MADPYNDKLAIFASNLAFGPPLGGLSLPWFEYEALQDAVLLAILIKLDVDLPEKMDDATRCVERPGLIHETRLTVRDDIVRLERTQQGECRCKETYVELDPDLSQQVIKALDAWKEALQDLDRHRPSNPVLRARSDVTRRDEGAVPSAGVGPHRSVKKRVCRTVRIKCPGKPRLPKKNPIPFDQDEETRLA
ncbi:hypothetical protein V5O48_009400 [Marasmius crinis-equi]|uniref:Uncharacterized protein n=1 Tax=Marasmius crinis-equi TaxID=585013 RepID=A0ABR3FBK0_9AGAR